MNTKDLINHLTEDIIKLYDIKIPITDIDAVVEKLGGKVVNTSELQHKMENCYIKKHKDAFVIKYTGENPVACLWDEVKIKKRRKSRFLIHEKFSCTDISYL